MSLTEKISDSEEGGCFIATKNFLVLFDLKLVAAAYRKGPKVKNKGSYGFNLQKKRKSN